MGLGLSDLLASFIEGADNKSLTLTWVFTIVVLTIALLGTWNFIDMVVSDLILGIIMVFGGLIMVMETVFEEGFDYEDFNDVGGVITAMFAMLYGAGLISGSQYFLTHFGGVQVGVILFLELFLVWEGLVNRS